MKVLGVLLAAGAGSRFRGPTHKLRADIDGRTVAEISWASMALAGLDGLAVVTGAVDLSDLLPGDAIVENHEWATGMRSSVIRALDIARTGAYDAVVIGLADQPSVPSSAWSRVARADGDIVVATYGGRRGNPVKLSSRAWTLFLESPGLPDEGARGLIASHPELVSEVACEGSPDDIDTVDDLPSPD